MTGTHEELKQKLEQYKNKKVAVEKDIARTEASVEMLVEKKNIIVGSLQKIYPDYENMDMDAEQIKLEAEIEKLEAQLQEEEV